MASAVHGLEGTDQIRTPSSQGGVVGRATQTRAQMNQAQTLVERHHPIGSAVRIQQGVHPHQRRVMTRRQHARFGHEGL